MRRRPSCPRGANSVSIVTPTVERLPAGPGTYAVLFRVRGEHAIAVGRLGRLVLRTGWYVYVGSAFGPGGLAARVGRHLRPNKTARWHVDYLRAAAEPVGIWTSTDPVPREHNWAAVFQGLPGASIPLPGFGASDCRCAAHLFFFRRPPDPDRIRRCLPGGLRGGDAVS